MVVQGGSLQRTLQILATVDEQERRKEEPFTGSQEKREKGGLVIYYVKHVTQASLVASISGQTSVPLSPTPVSAPELPYPVQDLPARHHEF